jgi:hypothetical protein
MDEMRGVVINGRRLVVCKNGDMYGFDRFSNEMYLIENVANHHTGYNYITCCKKVIYRHRIMGYTFLDLDINNPKQQIDHKDCNRLNNSLDNLRMVNHQQNGWNRINHKGYTWNKRAKKWKASIKLNGKSINLGGYDSESEARNAYIAAKLIYHKII